MATLQAKRQPQLYKTDPELKKKFKDKKVSDAAGAAAVLANHYGDIVTWLQLRPTRVELWSMVSSVLLPGPQRRTSSVRPVPAAARAAAARRRRRRRQRLSSGLAQRVSRSAVLYSSRRIFSSSAGRPPLSEVGWWTPGSAFRLGNG